ncbi:MAG: protein kinase [Phycisphaeraceae bacterium]|nr:protein kinase [Phycisphaeraceae bacterium]
MQQSDSTPPGGADAASQGSTAQSPRPHAGSRPGEHIGPYKLLELIGEGGFGSVWLAERRDPFVQRVALKVIKPGMDSRGVIARFDQERQALAVMDHPNVARVLDGGISTPEQGSRPFFVMEYVKGEPITTYCDRNRLTIRQRLELFIPVCEAVQHAHHKGIIHRDLKPTNVLVTVVEGRLTPKVIDFGVAKAMSHTLTHHTILTEHGQLIGTPEYMSPEQAEMGGTDIDTRTDVYSLGVLLYELLAGRLPFEPATLRSAALDEVRRIIREEEPPKPSTRLTTLDADAATAIARQRQAERGELASALRRELDWIPLKAMRKDRSRRYGTPGALAEDIQRYLEDKPIEAAPESRAYLLKKFVRRYRGGIVAAGAVTAALLLGVGVSLVFMAKAELRRVEAEAATEEARRQTAIAEQRYDELAKEKSRAERVAEMMSLLARAQQELHAPSSGNYTYHNYYDLVRKLDDGYLHDSPEEDFAIRQAFAATVAKSTDDEYHDDALRVLTQGIESARTRYGATHGAVLELLRSAITASIEARLATVAERWATERLNALRQLHPNGHPDVVDGLLDLARSVALAPDEARSVAILEQALGTAAGLTPRAPRAYERAFHALSAHYGKHDRNDDRTRILLDFARQAASGDMPSAEDHVLAWAEELERSGNPNAAAECWSALVDLRARRLSSGDWRIENARSRLGGALLALGRFAEAEPLLTASALALRGSPEAHRTASENRVIEAFERVSRLYEAWNRAEPDPAREAAAADWAETVKQVRAEEAEVARQIAERTDKRDRARSLNNGAWYIVRFAQDAGAAGAGAVEKALSDAAAAVELADDAISRAHYLNTQGVAQFRAGLYAEAIKTLTRADEAYVQALQPEQCGNWVFIAIAHRRLGQHEQAEAGRAKYESLRAVAVQHGQPDEFTAWHAEYVAEFPIPAK